MAGLTGNVARIKDPLGDLSVENTQRIRVVSEGISQQIPVWDRQLSALEDVQTELRNLRLTGPTGESFFDDFLNAHGDMIKRLDGLSGQGQAATREIIGLLAATADAYKKAEEYNVRLAAQRLP